MKSLSELNKIRDGLQAHMSTRVHSEDDIQVVVAMATAGIAAGARNVLTAIMDEVSKKGLKNVKISQCGCTSCGAPVVAKVTMPGKEPVVYAGLNEQKAREIVNSHLIAGKPVTEYMSK